MLEFDQGREQFFKDYEIRNGSRTWFIKDDGKYYDMKALFYSRDKRHDRQKGNHTDLIKKKMKSLGFIVERKLDYRVTETNSTVEKQINYYETLSRPEQAKFRQSLLHHFGSNCVISGPNCERALEAAHIQPFSKKGVDTLLNGILLRADLHRLFDAGELAIDVKSMKPKFSVRARAAYKHLHDKKPIEIPAGGPTAKSFEIRWKAYTDAHP